MLWSAVELHRCDYETLTSFISYSHLLILVKFQTLNVLQFLNLFQQCTVNMVNGKLVCKSDKFYHEQEIKGSEMVEVSVRK